MMNVKIKPNNKNQRGHLAAWFARAIRWRSLSHTKTTLPNASYFRRYIGIAEFEQRRIKMKIFGMNHLRFTLFKLFILFVVAQGTAEARAISVAFGSELQLRGKLSVSENIEIPVGIGGRLSDSVWSGDPAGDAKDQDISIYVTIGSRFNLKLREDYRAFYEVLTYGSYNKFKQLFQSFDNYTTASVVAASYLGIEYFLRDNISLEGKIGVQAQYVRYFNSEITSRVNYSTSGYGLTATYYF